MKVVRRDNPAFWHYLLGNGPKMPIPAIETGCELGFVDSDKTPARKSRPGSRKREDNGEQSLL